MSSSPKFIESMAKTMRVTGMLLFMDAFLDSLSKKSSILSIVHAAQAAEILLKARIADEHPLLIFKKIPEKKTAERLSLEMLIEKGQTLSYAELPDRLWASSGVTLDNLEGYYEFGRLRNQIIHTSIATHDDLNWLSLKFNLEILDPLVESFWGKSVIDFVRKHPDRSKDLENNLWAMSIHGDDLLINQCEKIPRLRRLIGDEAVHDWLMYKEKLKTEIEFHKIQESELNELHGCLSEEDAIGWSAQEEYDLEYAKWETFIDEFKQQ
jgi:FAD/FMN-containing dehydrogenase